MNKNNQPNQPDPEQREPRIGDAYVLGLIQDAPNPQAAHLVEEVYARHGTPFAVYLSLQDVDPYSSSVETEFGDAYIATYHSPDGLIQDTIDSLGWQDDLDRLLEGNPSLRAVVQLDRTAIWDFIADHYNIVSLADQIHVFERWP